MITQKISFELDWLKKWNQYSPLNKAVTNGDTGEYLNYQQFYAKSVLGADFLNSVFKIKKVSRVLLLSTNEVSSLVLFFSLARLGAALVPINYRLTVSEIQYLIDNSDPELIIYEPQYFDLLNSVDIKQKKTYPLIGKNSFEDHINAQTDPENLEKLNSELGFNSEPESTALIIYTSGTTGFPKGAMISHRALFWNSLNTMMRLNITDQDSAVIFLPLFHTGGWNVLTTPFFHRGAHIILTKKFDADQILKLSESNKCTLLFGVPTTMAMMSKSPLFKKCDLSKIRYAIVGGEPMPISEIELWQTKNIPIRQGYGLTEFGPNVFSLNESDTLRKKGSIGFANFYIQTQIVNEANEICKAHQIGELWLKGEMMMTGYWKDDEATRMTIVDGWLKTGDLVQFDNEGYFYVVGRKKEMYKSGGENVYPAEIEKVLMSISAIKEAAVIGVKDELWGEVGHAYISINNGMTYNEDEIRQHVFTNLAKFKHPKFYTCLPDLPKGDSGKILKRQLLNTKH